MEEQSLYYFRLKMECNMEESNGSLSKKKIEELVLASSYTEAESIAHELIENLGRSQFGSVTYEIVKTKIVDVLFNDILVQDNCAKNLVRNYFEEDEISGVGLYAVKVIFVSIDEKTAKEKKQTEVFYVPAMSNADATNRINLHLKESISDFVIRDTKFDKAEAIYWPSEVHMNKELGVQSC